MGTATLNEHILVVDDEPGVVATCVRTLNRAGYMVEGVGDSNTALDRLNREVFDLLLTDIRMPGRDGLELLALAKEVDPHLSVVMVTGYGTMDDALRAIRLGAQGFLLKPFDPDELVEAVQDTLRRRALIRDSLRLQTLLPLLEINDALRSTDGALNLAQQVLEVALRETGASRLWLTMRSRPGGGFATVASVGNMDEKGSLSADILDQVFETGEPVWIDSGGRVHMNPSAARRVIALSRPLLIKDQVIGILNAEKDRDLPPFSQLSLELLVLLSGQLAIAIENVELYQRQQALRAFNEDIIQTMTNGLVVVDESARVTVFNQAAAALLGYHASEVVGQPLRDAVPGASSLADAIEATLRHANETSPLRSRFEATVRGSQAISAIEIGARRSPGEVSVLHRDGNVLPLAISASPLRDASGQVTGVVCLFEDLSEAKALEAERRRLDRLAALGEMSAVVAHEIRNPVAGIAVGVEYLSKSIPEESVHKQDVKMILSEIERVNRILDDILSVARPFQLKLSSQAMPDIVEHVLHRYHTTFSNRAIHVIRRYAPSLPRVQVDRERIEQALTNLVLNAVEAMSTGGTLSLGLAAGDRWLTITVSDTGSGIPPEVQRRIFEPFFTTKVRGTGLGLAVTRRVIEEHGGTITLTSETGKGATFTVRVPLPAEGVS
jgi:PAS domain S-box-containing protein